MLLVRYMPPAGSVRRSLIADPQKTRVRTNGVILVEAPRTSPPIEARQTVARGASHKNDGDRPQTGCEKGAPSSEERPFRLGLRPGAVDQKRQERPARSTMMLLVVSL
jgi:hypothetical protein